VLAWQRLAACDRSPWLCTAPVHALCYETLLDSENPRYVVLKKNMASGLGEMPMGMVRCAWLGELVCSFKIPMLLISTLSCLYTRHCHAAAQ
jgi:hypothetical protein